MKLKGYLRLELINSHIAINNCTNDLGETIRLPLPSIQSSLKEFEQIDLRAFPSETDCRKDQLPLFLETIKLLASSQPKSLTIETSSCYILLATPFLKALKNQASVVILIDKNNEKRRQEQARVVKALKNAGINVMVRSDQIEEEKLAA